MSIIMPWHELISVHVPRTSNVLLRHSFWIQLLDYCMYEKCCPIWVVFTLYKRWTIFLVHTVSNKAKYGWEGHYFLPGLWIRMKLTRILICPEKKPGPASRKKLYLYPTLEPSIILNCFFTDDLSKTKRFNIYGLLYIYE